MQQLCRPVFLVAAWVFACLPLIPRAEVLTWVMPETAIPDADPAGILVRLPDAPPIASVDKLSLTIAHEWLGDLTVKLIGPDGVEFTIFERIDLLDAPPDGSSAILGGFVFEDNRGVLVPRTYPFARIGADFGAAARLAVETQLAPVVPPDVLYGAQTWAEGPFAAGSWSLLLSDSAEFSGGVIDAAQLFYTAVPEPRVTVLVMIGVGWVVWRRGRGPGQV